MNSSRQTDNSHNQGNGSGLPTPKISRINGRDQWRLEEPYTVAIGGRRFRIPEGFVFDVASVPWFLRWLIAPFELSIAAPLIHDFLYRYAGNPPEGTVAPNTTWSRAQADRLFLQLMRAENVPGWRRILAWLGVRLFGWLKWGEGV